MAIVSCADLLDFEWCSGKVVLSICLPERAQTGKLFPSHLLL